MYIDTKKIIENMMNEGYDSYRNKNKKQTYENTYYSKVDFSRGYINVSHNLYRYLNDHLVYDKDVDHAYKVMVRYLDFILDEKMYYTDLSKLFPTFLGYYLDRKSGGSLNFSFDKRKRKFVGDELPDIYRFKSCYGDEIIECGYTYNEEINNLSQDFQYFCFEMNDVRYAIVQVHNGIDAREGLSAPKVFYIKSDEGYFIRGVSNATIGCENNHQWYSDYYDFLPADDEKFNLDKFKCLDDGTSDGKFELGKVCFYKNDHHIDDKFFPAGTGLCPCCGSVLTSWY